MLCCMVNGAVQGRICTPLQMPFELGLGLGVDNAVVLIAEFGLVCVKKNKTSVLDDRHLE